MSLPEPLDEARQPPAGYATGTPAAPSSLREAVGNVGALKSLPWQTGSHAVRPVFTLLGGRTMFSAHEKLPAGA